MITHNIKESYYLQNEYKFSIRRRYNIKPHGFGFNHNQVFFEEKPDIFIVVNPDIRLTSIFDINTIIENIDSAAILSPIILDINGNTTDFIREDLTPFNLVKRLLKFHKTPKKTDWFGGVFLIFPGALFNKLSGFDTRYFMYVEDCDICWRCRLIGGNLKVLDCLRVVHDARRDSHKSIKYLKWHVMSIYRYWIKRIEYKFSK